MVNSHKSFRIAIEAMSIPVLKLESITEMMCLCDRTSENLGPDGALIAKFQFTAGRSD